MLAVIKGIVETASRNAYAPALITDNRSISYGELLALLARISGYIADQRPPPLSRVFVNIGNPDLALIATLAAMHAGLVPIILQRFDSQDEIGPRLVIGGGPPNMPDLKADIVIDEGVLTGGKGNPMLRDLPDRDDDDMLYVGATTGTTGKRKLVAERAGDYRERQAAMPDFVAGDRVMFTAGATTVLGFAFTLRLLTVGATHLRLPPNADLAAKFINFSAVGKFLATPGVLSDLMEAMERGRARCPSIRHILLFGSLFEPALIERAARLFDAELFVSYGTTEVGRVTFGRIDPKGYVAGDVGRMEPDMRLVSTGNAAEPGPVVVANDRFRSYYSMGKLAERPTQLALPDLGYVKDGRLHLVGRDDEVFNFDGNKTAYSVIERALLALGGVSEVGIAGGAAIEDSSALVIAVAGAAAIDLGQLQKTAAAAARAEKAPDKFRIVKVDRVPRNAMGKIDREGIARAYLARSAPAPAPTVSVSFGATRH